MPVREVISNLLQVETLAVGHRSVSFLSYNPPHNLEIQLIAYAEDKSRVGTLVPLRRITLVFVVYPKIEKEVLHQGKADTLLSAEVSTYIRAQVIVELV